MKSLFLVPFSGMMFFCFNIAVAQFAKDDEVELVRDEPLLFNGTVYRQGKKGEPFPVVTYRPDLHRVFLLATDNAGKPFALAVPDSAVMLSRRNVSSQGDQAFAALRSGQLDIAQKSLLIVSRMDPEREACGEIGARAGSLSEAVRSCQDALTRQQQQQPEIERRLRNAAVADRPNPLAPGDTSGRKRAADMRREAMGMQTASKDEIGKAREQIKTELKAFDDLARKRATVGAYEEALDIMQLCTLMGGRYLERTAFTSSIPERARLEMQANAAAAQEKLTEAKKAVGLKKLNTARVCLQEGLRVEPGSANLRELNAQVDARLQTFGKNCGLAYSQVQVKHFDDALRTLEQARTDCVDDRSTENLVATLKKTIAEKDERLVAARTAEAARDFGTALEIYDTYGMETDAKRVLPTYAKEQEAAGNLLLAYVLYGRAELTADMQRVKKGRDGQAQEYEGARVLLAEGKFTDAIAIYRRYKDKSQEKDATLQQGAALEGKEKFDEALVIYHQAQLADEVARVKTFLADRSGWLADAAHQEQAANYDKALELFQKANAKTDIQRVATKMAKDSEAKKDYESAVAYFEIAGLYEEAGRIRQNYDLARIASVRKLSDSEIFKRCGPACVTVISDSEEGRGLGSGFFIAKGGYILTNHHVIDGSVRIRIETAAQKQFSAHIVDSSLTPDLALLKADIAENPVLKLGDSDKVETGAHVAAIGSPKGLSQSFTAGNISNCEREYEGNKCFQMSVLINHGNSGGPLFDEMGSVIGINTFGEGTATVLNNGMAIGSDIQGINYAVKINEARKLISKKIPGFETR